ncbi:MAG: lysophospholipid acyltransferase family protein [Oscillospiraceae bacterium]
MNFYNCVKSSVHFLLHILYKVEVKGYNNLNSIQNKGVIICCNHVSLIDPVAILSETKGKVNFLGKIELFKNKLSSWLFKKMAVIPVNRGHGSSNAIKTSVDLLNKKETLCIFPEGTRSKTKQLLSAKSGAALIAFMAKADVLPVSVRYEKHLFRRKKIVLNCGEIIKYNEFNFKQGTPNELKAASKLIMNHIANLLYNQGGEEL